MPEQAISIATELPRASTGRRCPSRLAGRAPPPGAESAATPARPRARSSSSPAAKIRAIPRPAPA